MESRKDRKVYKYGQPLFAAVWPHGDTLFVAGGGGKPGTGIENRIIAAQYKQGQLTDEVACVRLKEACERLAMAPSGRLMLAVTSTGLMAFELDSSSDTVEFLVPQEHVLDSLLAASLQHASAVRFSVDGSVVVIATKEGGVSLCHGRLLQQYAWLDTAVCSTGSNAVSEAKDVDVMLRDNGYVVATASEGGDANLWAVRGSLAGGLSVERGFRLAKPRGMVNHIVKHCRFARDGSGDLICSLNYKGKGCLVRWQLHRSERGHVAARSPALSSPITGMDVSPDGAHVGVCTSEGEAMLLDARRLRVMRRNRKAHMVFGTEVAWAADGGAMVSLSADASARITALDAKASGAISALMYLLLVALVAIGGAVAAALAGLGEEDVRRSLWGDWRAAAYSMHGALKGESSSPL